MNTITETRPAAPRGRGAAGGGFHTADPPPVGSPTPTARFHPHAGCGHPPAVSSPSATPAVSDGGRGIFGEPLTIVLPLPPTANKLWAPVRTAGGAKMVKRKPYAYWSAMAAREVAAQRAGSAMGTAFAAVILLPDDGPFDLDNLVKPLMDACEDGGAITNDRLMRRLWVDVDDTRTGTALIELTPLPPAGSAPSRTTGNARMEPTS